MDCVGTVYTNKHSPVANNHWILTYRGVDTVRHFRHVPTHNFFPQFFFIDENDCLFYVYCTDDKLPQVER